MSKFMVASIHSSKNMKAERNVINLIRVPYTTVHYYNNILSLCISYHLFILLLCMPIQNASKTTGEVLLNRIEEISALLGQTMKMNDNQSVAIGRRSNIG